jgi:flagellar basal body P-ring protein FlgI
MIKFNLPTNLNGSELLTELNDANVKITKPPFVDGNNNLWLDIDVKDETKAKAIVDAHNGTTVAPELTINQKLASVGLTIDDLKIALGL